MAVVELCFEDYHSFLMIDLCGPAVVIPTDALCQHCFLVRFHIRQPPLALFARRPIILCRRSTGIEQSAVSCTGCIVAYHLPMRTENISFLLEFSGPLVANSLSPPMLYAGTLLTV